MYLIDPKLPCLIAIISTTAQSTEMEVRCKMLQMFLGTSHTSTYTLASTLKNAIVARNLYMAEMYKATSLEYAMMQKRDQMLTCTLVIT